MVLDQAKIELGRLKDVPFDLHSLFDNVLSLFSNKPNDKGIELAVMYQIEFLKLLLVILGGFDK